MCRMNSGIIGAYFVKGIYLDIYQLEPYTDDSKLGATDHE